MGSGAKKTSAAIRQLQSKAKIPATGEVDAATGLVITRVLKTGKIEKEQPTVFITHQGKTLGYTQKQYDKMKKEIISRLRQGPMLDMRRAADAADILWKHFDKLNKDQWLVSWCIEATRGVDLPKRGLINKALAAASKMESYLKSGKIDKFIAEMSAAERTCNLAIDKMDAYRIAMTEGAGKWVERLGFTKTASFLFLGVFAAPVTAGALGTGALASAVIGGAAVAATKSTAEEIGKGSAGQKNWTVAGAISNVVIDTGVGAIVGVFNKGGSGGKHIFEAAISKYAPRMAAEHGFKHLSKETLKRFAVYLFTEGAKETAEGAIKDAAEAAKGDKKMTMDKFTGNLVNNFTKGVALGPFAAVVGKYGAGFVPKKFKNMVRDQTLKAVSKSSKGTVHISEVDKKTLESIEKLIGDAAKKGVEDAFDSYMKTVKGKLSPKKLEKKMDEVLFSSSNMKAYVAMASKELEKSLKKKKRR